MTKTNILTVLFLMISFVSFAEDYHLKNNNVIGSTTILAGDLVGLVANIGSAEATIHVDMSISITADLTIPKNIGLKFYEGSKLTIDQYMQLTINGPMDAGAFQIFVCAFDKDQTTGYPLIDKAFPQWWHGGQESWSDAIQRAVDFFPKVFFPPMGQRVNDTLEYTFPYYIDKTIRIDLKRRAPSGYILYGVGRGSFFQTRKDNKTLFSDHVFDCTNTDPNGDGYGYNSGLIFENLSFFCQKAINIQGGGDNLGATFADEKWPILNIRINNCMFQNNSLTVPSQNDNVCITMRKVFDSEIAHNYIDGFGYGILLNGCDINTIRDNRIVNFSHYAIEDHSFSDFEKGVSIGSQNAILHNDLLAYIGESYKEDKPYDNMNAFIKTNSNHVEIRDNYLENQNKEHKLFAYIDCSLVGMTNIDKDTRIANHESFHIDLTGNRLDSTKDVTQYRYFINENFKSLNLIEIPNYTEESKQAFSTFAEMKYDSSAGKYVWLAVTHIPLRIKWEPSPDPNTGQINEHDKLINMKNCFSFRDWANFSTSNVFSDSSNGDIVINSQNLSYTSRLYGYNPPTFNPRSFRLDPGNGSCGKDTDCPGLYIIIDQKYINADLGDLFTKIRLKLKARNLGPTTTSTGDLYLRIEEFTGSSSPVMVYENQSVTLPPAAPGFNYSVITLPVNHSFDSNKSYQLAITSKSDCIKEIKEVVIESADKEIVDPDDMSAQKEENPDEKQNKGNTILEEKGTESIRQITVKVDHDIPVYPNPAQSQLTIDVKKSDTIKSIKVYAENGTFIGDYTERLDGNVIDISALPNGNYIVEITTVSNTSKVIIKE